MLLQLLPIGVSNCNVDKLYRQICDEEDDPNLSEEKTLEHWGYKMFYLCFTEFRAVKLRKWWNKLQFKQSLSIKKFVSLFVTTSLINLEIRNIMSQNYFCKNLVLKVPPFLKKFIVEYKIDNMVLRMIISFSRCYPLDLLEIEWNTPVIEIFEELYLEQLKNDVFQLVSIKKFLN